MTRAQSSCVQTPAETEPPLPPGALSFPDHATITPLPLFGSRVSPPCPLLLHVSPGSQSLREPCKHLLQGWQAGCWGGPGGRASQAIPEGAGLFPGSPNRFHLACILGRGPASAMLSLEGLVGVGKEQAASGRTPRELGIGCQSRRSPQPSRRVAHAGVLWQLHWWAGHC